MDLEEISEPKDILDGLKVYISLNAAGVNKI